MEAKNNKIAVLSDLDGSLKNTLKSAVSVARATQGEIELFYVKKPTDVVKTDNQFSALRSMKDEFCETDLQIQDMIHSFSKEYQVNIEYRFSFGNVKQEINHYLKEQQPDIVLMRKRPAKPFGFLGDGITQFVLDHYKGAVVLVSDKVSLEPNQPFSVGLLNGAEPPAFLNGWGVQGEPTRPFKTFRFMDKSKSIEANTKKTNNEREEFVFEQNEDSIKNLSKYLLKNSINLLCIDRNLNSEPNKVNLVAEDVKKAMSIIEVSMLFKGNQHSITT